MRRWSAALGRPAPVPAAWLGQRTHGWARRAAVDRDGQVEHAVAFAVRRAAGRLPFRSSCLAEAFAGQVLLRRRGCGGVVVIGLRRMLAADAADAAAASAAPDATAAPDGSGAADAAGRSGGSGAAGPQGGAGASWEAHAWLVGRTGVLTGGPAARGFTATSVFQVPGRPSAADLATHTADTT